MATGFNTQIIDGMFQLQFETDKREYYEYVQAAARDCLDGKATDKCHRWISVEERLPEKHEGVIVHCNDGFLTLMCYDGRDWQWNGKRDNSVTHWMPLPEPPEVNEK